jgi:hypothetical protein
LHTERSGYYLGEGIGFGFMAGLIGSVFFKKDQDRSLWIQFVLICINVFVIYKLYDDSVAQQNLVSTSKRMYESIDYASGKRDSPPSTTDATAQKGEPQTVEQLMGSIAKEIESAAPVLRENRDEIARLDLGSVLSSNTLCSSNKRAQARTVLGSYRELTLRRIELASDVQRTIKEQIYNYHGASRDNFIRGFEKTAGNSIALMDNIKNVEVSITTSAADVLSLADEKDGSIQCNNGIVYWPDQKSLDRYNKSMAEIKVSAAKEAKINAEIELNRKKSMQLMTND